MSPIHSSFGHHGTSMHSHSTKISALRISVDFNPGYTLLLTHIGKQGVVDSAILDVQDKLSSTMDRYGEYKLESSEPARAKLFFEQNSQELNRLFELKISDILSIKDEKMSVFYPLYEDLEKGRIIQILDLLTIIAKRG